MKTDELIAALSREPPQAGSLPMRMAAALVGATVLCALVVVGLGWPRPDLASALGDGRVALKLLLVLLVAVSSLRALLRLGVPGQATPRWLLALPSLVLGGGALGAALYAALALSAQSVHERVLNAAALRCAGRIALVTALSLPLLLRAYRAWAPTRPRLAAYHLGLTSSAVGSLVYVLACRQDDPLFVAVWYGLSMLAMGALSALLTRRRLGW